MKADTVFEVTDYFDGPREGTASLNGQRCHFKSRHLDATEYKGDLESVDIFELTPVGSPKGSKPILATAEFLFDKERAPEEAMGYFQVTWHVIK